MDSLTFVLSLLVLGVHSLLVFGVECNIEGKKVRTGQTHTPKGQCVGYKCVFHNQYLGSACPLSVSAKNCKMTPPDLSQPYPACCNHYEDC